MNFSYSENYYNQLQEGQKFQDYCAYVLQTKLSIGVINFQSKEFQFKFGENMQGVEFKFDNLFQNTGNLWIEVEERTNPELNYSNSGILRKDNSWLYCIGDYRVLYIFSKKFLANLYNSKRYEVIENNLMTSKGFLLPKTDADKYSAYKIENEEITNESSN